VAGKLKRLEGKVRNADRIRGKAPSGVLFS
jgi:hypothetical protein